MITTTNDIVDYINSDGIVTILPRQSASPGDGNGVLQTGLAFVTNKIYFDVQFFDTLMQQCMSDKFKPLIYRSPHKKNHDDNQAADDYYGALAIGWALKSSWPEKVLEFAESNSWNFDLQSDQRPARVNYRFDRFPAFAPFLRMCARKNISIIDEIILALTIVWDSFNIDHADGNIRTMCKVFVARKASAISKIASALWVYKIKKKYGTIGASWANYFGPGHPLNDYDEK